MVNSDLGKENENKAKEIMRVKEMNAFGANLNENCKSTSQIESKIISKENEKAANGRLKVEKKDFYVSKKLLNEMDNTIQSLKSSSVNESFDITKAHHNYYP
jgi:hypothetical protein